MRHHHGPHCGCPKQIVYPTQENVVHHCTEETVEHIHPSHTTIMNHHLVKNQHVYPHSTSVGNTVDSVDQYGGSFNVPPNQVAGAATPPGGPGNQVAGTMSPGGPNMGPGYQQPFGMKGWKKPKKWC
ncbi:spore coat protein [Sediminibacillus dalangtanensis]|uniref:Spore coat protein n=1 Tax=Sediminibacillus dalangtanensis TaxID=2729421 RepID=A0ABX7VSX0_9BACI|nr:spore coat protein [Sediminibacillus dalangtanensis]QTM99618.1 spore coat protein [Sediminibacillus dalangtanensis]